MRFLGGDHVFNRGPNLRDTQMERINSPRRGIDAHTQMRKKDQFAIPWEHTLMMEPERMKDLPKRRPMGHQGELAL